MRISNKQTAAKYKRVFFLVSIVITVATLGLFLLDYTIFGLAGVGLFSLWYLYFHVADFQFIEYRNDNKKIVLRYYKAIGFGSNAYHSIEFPQNILQNAHFEDSVFGKFTDITFIVRTQRGIAEYPSVSLTAVKFADRQRIRESLYSILQE